MAFDFYRTFRRWLGWGGVITFIGDLVFSLVALSILFYFFERANELSFRFYIIWGSLLGLILYLKLLSRFLVRIFFGTYGALAYLAKLILRGIKIPMSGLVLLMRPPYSILRWLSVLLYRIGEVIILGPVVSVKRSIIVWVNRLIPPKIDG